MCVYGLNFVCNIWGSLFFFLFLESANFTFKVKDGRSSFIRMAHIYESASGGLLSGNCLFYTERKIM